jgi:hypothetical protein
MNSFRRFVSHATVALGLSALLAGCATPMADYPGIVAAPDRSEADRKND